MDKLEYIISSLGFSGRPIITVAYWVNAIFSWSHYSILYLNIRLTKITDEQNFNIKNENVRVYAELCAVGCCSMGVYNAGNHISGKEILTILVVIRKKERTNIKLM